MGPNELWQPKNAVYFLNEIGQFHFFYRLEVFCNFFGLLFIYFVTNLLFLASLFMRNENE